MSKAKRKPPFKVRVWSRDSNSYSTRYSNIKSESEAQDMAKAIIRKRGLRSGIQVVDANGDTCWDSGYATYMPGQPKGRNKH